MNPLVHIFACLHSSHSRLCFFHTTVKHFTFYAWSQRKQLSSMPSSLHNMRAFHLALVVNDEVVENKWEEIADMQQERGCAFGVVTQGKIFIGGGRHGSALGATSKTCEMYNISTNVWQSIGSLNVDREWGSMVCVKGTLYVLGGTWEYSRSDLSVECYDPTEDKWIKKTTIPVKAISRKNENTFSGCALKLSKGALDKAYVVRE